MENDNGHMDLVIKEGFGAIANTTNSAGEMFHHPGKAMTARVVDSLLRLSLLIRGRTPGGMAAAAEAAGREHLDVGRCTYHGRVLRDGGYVVLQYWFFYVFNDWRSTFSGINDHEADWELVTVYLADDGEAPVPRWVAASCHDHSGDELRRAWDDPGLLREGDHPVIFAGAGSHAGAFAPSDMVVSVDLPILRRVVEGSARLVRRLVPLARWTPQQGAFGLPFLDYMRGDGTTVGPGGDRAWDAHVVTDATAWVRDYRGLWGLDTHDVLGGERAPAGPRYERGGRVRASWADPLGWAGLRKEPPSDAVAEEDLREQIKSLDSRVRALDLAVAAEHATLRRAAVELRSLSAGSGGMHASMAAKRTALRQSERALAELSAERTRVADEREIHRAHLADPAAYRGGVPLTVAEPARPSGRPRLLRAWGALSTPLLLLTIVLLLVGPPFAFLPSVALAVVVFVAVEAAARGKFLTFVVGLGMVAIRWSSGWWSWSPSSRTGGSCSPCCCRSWRCCCSPRTSVSCGADVSPDSLRRARCRGRRGRSRRASRPAARGRGRCGRTAWTGRRRWPRGR